MSSHSRDPRKDPRPGDVVRFVGRKIFVQGLAHGRVHYDVFGIGSAWVTLRDWFVCMTNAEVLHVAA